ncbi:FecR family protein [Chitinophaga rhizosphaerae]|uniref:FecR family protein n=1 Tax=Chitinophaga rhizosphaerae TaxID=1864947 RepID=UPI000F8099BD|nr:FecR family protein [Chitinophaga rhizosphaerae]
MEKHNRLQYLLERMASGAASDAELGELQALVDHGDSAIGEAESWLEAARPETAPPFDRQHWMQVADRILAADKRPADEAAPPKLRVHFLHRWWSAAAAVLFVAAGVWYFNRHQPVPQPMVSVNAPPDVAPGKNGAILTLSDGSQLELDSAGNGLISRQSGTAVVLGSDGLQYTPEDPGAGELKYNTIATSKGRQFTVTLPDGSKVWLNAASSLRFPVAFNGGERAVELSGEGYFEVAKDAAKPFRVKVPGKLDLEVLGTSFNVNAYANERNSYTTLVTGAVRIAQAGNAAGAMVLRPGEQLQAGGNGMEVIPGANLDKAVAWKNGLFNFDGAGLRDMMRQLERWYDLEVVYEGNVPDVVFFGEMSRKLKLSDVLSGLERSDVHFRLEEGRRLVVMP